MQVILSNDFHGTQVQVAVMGRLPYTLTPGQAAKVRRTLCGQKGCACGVVRGPGLDGRWRKVGVAVVGGADGRGRWAWRW